MAGKKEELTEFATVTWTWGDVQTLRPSWTKSQCEEWLNANEKYIQEAMTTRGWEAIEDLLPAKSKKDKKLLEEM